MARMIETRVLGVPDLAAKLRGAGDKLAARALRKALKKGGAQLLAAVQERTPVRTGLTRDAAQLKVSVSGQKTRGRARVGFGKRGYIARFVEFGHRQVTHEGKDAGHVPAHPFLRPAFDQAAGPAVEAFVEEIRRALPVLAEPGGGGGEAP